MAARSRQAWGHLLEGALRARVSLRPRWLVLVRGVHARRCWFRWAAWLGEQSVAPVAADGRHTNHCFESAAHRPTAAVRLSLHPGPSDTHTPGPAQRSAAGALGRQRASPPLSARLAASGRADADAERMLLRSSPSACACNAALSGPTRACSCCTSIANTQPAQSAPALPAYAPSATRRVPSFHTRFDHARSGLIDRQPITSSTLHACRFNALETPTHRMPPDTKDLASSTAKPPSAAQLQLHLRGLHLNLHQCQCQAASTGTAALVKNS